VFSQKQESPNKSLGVATKQKTKNSTQPRPKPVSTLAIQKSSTQHPKPYTTEAEQFVKCISKAYECSDLIRVEWKCLLKAQSPYIFAQFETSKI
jgi:hypothetical protein